MATNAINSLSYGGNTYPFTLPYGVCSTAAATAAKVVTVDNFSLEAGAVVIVKFTNANSVANPTLNVNSTGAKAIVRYGSTTASTGTTTSGWTAGAVQLFVYDGTYWVRDYWYNTTYSLSGLGGVGTITASSTAPLNLSASKTGTSVTITGSITEPKSKAWWNGGVVTVRSDGVSEVGKYIDFHAVKDSEDDYNYRLTAGAGTLAGSGSFSTSTSITAGTSLHATGALTVGTTATVGSYITMSNSNPYVKFVDTAYSNATYYVQGYEGKLAFGPTFANAVQMDLNGNLTMKASSTLTPRTNNTGTIGTSAMKWNAMYATTFVGALSGNATSATNASKVTLTDISTNGTYYLVSAAGTSGSQSLYAEGDAYYYYATSYSSLNVGKNTKNGIFTMHNSDHIANLQSATLTSDITHTFPATGGTVLNTGTTSWTAADTATAKIGTLKLNGSNKILYDMFIYQRGGEIAANTDLNTLKTPSVYHSPNSTRSATLGHTPWSSSGYRVITMTGYSGTSSYGWQLVPASSNIFWRLMGENNASPSDWYSWIKFKYNTAVGSSSRPIYLTSEGVPTAITTMSVAYGGTGVASHTANRLVWSVDANKIQAGYHYASTSKIGVNLTSEPSYNFYVNGTTYLNGLTTAKIGNSLGIKLGATYITSANDTNGEVVLQGGHLRFGGNSWDYNVWAGLKYNSGTKTIYLGLADNSIFVANAAQSGGTLALPGVRYFSINGKTVIDAGDAWLRINGSGAHSSGIYFGSSTTRTDGRLEVGSGGAKFYAASDGTGYFDNDVKAKGHIFAYNYGKDGNNAPAFVFDKNGGNYTGIGSHNLADTIWFGAVSSTDFTWVNDYYQNWYFNGNVEAAKQFRRVGISSSWYNGRDNAVVRMTTSSGYSVLASMKTTNGTWDIGNYNATSWHDILLFNYKSDTSYASGSSDNTVTHAAKLSNAGYLTLLSGLSATTGTFSGKVTLTGTTATTSQLAFTRTSDPSYIMAASYFCITPGGKATGVENADLIVKSGSVYPGTTNVTTLGSSSKRWSSIYGTTLYLNGNAYIGTTAGAGTGLSLYSNSAPDTYGIHMSLTSGYGKHGYVQNDWAMYFCFHGADTRGWIFRHAGTNVASISGQGHITGNYITGTWLQTTAATAVTTSSKIATLDANGWVYYITPANLVKFTAFTAGAAAGPKINLSVAGTTVTSAAIPSASSGASGIVTTGGQTFAGLKTFNSGLISKDILYLQDTALVKGTAPSESTGTYISFVDSKGTAAKYRTGMLYSYVDSSNNTHTRLYSYKAAAESTTSVALDIVYPNSGNTYLSFGSYFTVYNAETAVAVKGRVDMGCLLLTNTGWTGYGTDDPNDAELTKVKGRVYFKLI